MTDAQQQSTDAPAGTDRRRRDARGGGTYGFAAAGNSGGLVEVLNRHDLPEDVERLLEPELSRDHILGNLDEDEIQYRRFSLWNNKEMVMASFPPQGSLWQGPHRKEVDCLSDGRSALTQEQVHFIRDAFDAAQTRSSRSKGGWQQDKLADQSTERRQVVEDATEDSGGFLSRLMG